VDRTVREGARQVIPASSSRRLTSEVDDREPWAVPEWTRRLGLNDTPLPGGSDRSARVVLVIDDRTDGHVAWCQVADIIRFAGYSVIEAGFGADATMMLSHMRFDAVVLDRSVPDADVVSVLTGALERPPPTPTHGSRRGELRNRLTRGIVAHLDPPVRPEELVGAVARAVEHRTA